MSYPPPEIRPDILRFCNQICRGSDPVWVSVQPVSYAEQDDCFGTVSKTIKKRGGNRILGWDITEWPGVFMEAEFHAIWQSEEGALTDLSPKLLPYDRILFLPDHVRQYQGYRLDNIRIATNPDPLVARFIELSELMYEDMRKNKQLDQVGKLNMSREFAILHAEKAAVELQLMQKYGHRYIAGLQAIGISPSGL